MGFDFQPHPGPEFPAIQAGRQPCGNTTDAPDRSSRANVPNGCREFYPASPPAFSPEATMSAIAGARYAVLAHRTEGTLKTVTTDDALGLLASGAWYLVCRETEAAPPLDVDARADRYL